MSRSTYYFCLAAIFLFFAICFRASGWLNVLRGSDVVRVTIKDVKLVDLQAGKMQSFDVVRENGTSTALQIVGEQACCGMTFDTLPKEAAP